MKSIIIRYILIMMLLFFTKSFFGQADNSADDANSKPEESKTFPGIFSFYYKEKIGLENDTDRIYTLDLITEMNLSLTFPLKIYTARIWVDELFLTDFEPMINNFKDFYIGEIFFNSITIGTDNKISIRRVMDIFVNFEFGINTPFYDNLELYFNPVIRLSGNYYTGLNWELEQSFPIDSALSIGSMVLTSSTYIKLAYEFFRFYGPKNFKFTVLADNFLYYSIPYPSSANTLENQLRAGFLFSIYFFSPSGYFLFTFSESFPGNEIINEFIGFRIGAYFFKKYFSLSIDYTGGVDLSDGSLIWDNRVDFYIKVGF